MLPIAAKKTQEIDTNLGALRHEGDRRGAARTTLQAMIIRHLAASRLLGMRKRHGKSRSWTTFPWTAAATMTPTTPATAIAALAPGGGIRKEVVIPIPTIPGLVIQMAAHGARGVCSASPQGRFS